MSMSDATNEKAALEQRIDELCQEVERLQQELAIRELSEQEKVIDYLGKECVDWEDKYLALAGENAKLREWCADLYVLCYPHEVDWKLADSTWEKYEPCGLCKERHGGKSPCASTSGDMSEECCDPYQAELFAKCMAELGIEVPS